jgi:tRNA uridine 5-carbamoylmethylation protein Kti12
MTEITVKSNERVLLTGKTGSGKTYAAELLTRPLPRLIVLDPKGTLGAWGLAPFDREARRLLRNGDPIRARVVVSFNKPSDETWEDAFLAVLNAGDCTLYIDEIYGVVDPGAKPPPLLNAIWTRGRELGIGGWGATQRPVWVPMFVLSEAEHFFCFRLTVEEDRRRMSSFMGDRVMEPIRDKHGLFYMHAEDDEPMYIAQLPSNGRGPAPK